MDAAIWRIVCSESPSFHADPVRILEEWTLPMLLEAHAILDAVEEYRERQDQPEAQKL